MQYSKCHFLKYSAYTLYSGSTEMSTTDVKELVVANVTSRYVSSLTDLGNFGRHDSKYRAT